MTVQTAAPQRESTDYDRVVLGSRLRYLRNQKRQAQKDVAAQLDPPPTVALISAWELGHASISGHYFQQLCEIFPTLVNEELDTMSSMDRGELLKLIDRQRLENEGLKDQLGRVRSAFRDSEKELEYATSKS